MNEIVAYQGIEGSNAQRAAKLFSSTRSSPCELMPAISSKRVIDQILANKVDFGVVAIGNTLIGKIEETYEAVKGKDLSAIHVIELPISHVLASLPGVSPKNVSKIYSHKAALKQCSIFLSENFHASLIREEEDTALAAKKLASGEYDQTSAVICPLEAVSIYRLESLRDNISNDLNNWTRFIVLSNGR